MNKFGRFGRFLWIIAVAALVAAMLAPTSLALSTRIQLAVNDSLIQNPKGIGVEIEGGLIYVPIEVFTEHMGCGYSYDAISNSLTLYRDTRSINFNMKVGAAIDQDNRVHDYTAYFSGTFMVPAEFSARTLWLKYAYIGNGPIVRLYTGIAKLSNNELYRRYFAPDPEPLPPVEPADPGSPVTPVSKRIALTFDGAMGENTADILDTLSRYGQKATFFVTREEAGNHPQTLIKAIAMGHNVGILIEDAGNYSDHEAIVDEVNRCAGLITRIVKTRPRLVRLSYQKGEEAQSGLVSLLSDGGFRVWGSTVTASDGPTSSKSSSAVATGVITEAGRQSYGIVISFHGSHKTASALSSVISRLRAQGHTLIPISVTDDPPGRR